MPNDPNLPDHAAPVAQEVVSGDPVETVPDGVAGYRKAIVTFVIALATAIALAGADGSFTAAEIWTAVAGVLATTGGAYQVGNKQKVA